MQDRYLFRAKRIDNGEWIPADCPPETDETWLFDYILLSLENFPVPTVASVKERSLMRGCHCRNRTKEEQNEEM